MVGVRYTHTPSPGLNSWEFEMRSGSVEKIADVEDATADEEDAAADEEDATAGEEDAAADEEDAAEEIVVAGGRTPDSVRKDTK